MPIITDRPSLPNGLTTDEQNNIIRYLSSPYDQKKLFEKFTTLDDYRSLLDELIRIESFGDIDLISYITDARSLLEHIAKGRNPATGYDVCQPWGSCYDLELPSMEPIKSPYSASTTDMLETTPLNGFGESPHTLVDIPQNELSNTPAQISSGISCFMNDEIIGHECLSKTGFVLVAGGLGERLGFSDIKINLQVEQTIGTTFLQLFLQWMKSISNHDPSPFFVIMVSDDTHKRTLETLIKFTDCQFHPSLHQQFEEFGIKYSPPSDINLHNIFNAINIRIIKQNAVPCFEDSFGNLAVYRDLKNQIRITKKPHGHGDVHKLIHKYGIAHEMMRLGLKYILFFQDTNALFYHAASALVGHARHHNLDMCFLAIPRIPQEAVGALCLLSKDDHQLYQSVEYNLLGALLHATGGDVGQLRPSFSTPVAYSMYPGNTNVFVLRLDTYTKVLELSGGKVPDFINPKYKNDQKILFSSPARLECMMQDISLLISGLNRGPFHMWNHKIGYLELPRWICFSPIKNNLMTAVTKYAQGIPTESAFTAEFDYYAANLKMIEIALHHNKSNLRIFRYRDSHDPLIQSIDFSPHRSRLDSTNSKDIAEIMGTHSHTLPPFVWTSSIFGRTNHFTTTIDGISAPYFARIILDPSYAADISSLTNRFDQDIELFIGFGSTLIIRGNVQFMSGAKIHISGTVILSAFGDATITVRNLIVQNNKYYIPIHKHDHSISRNYFWQEMDSPFTFSWLDNTMRKAVDLQPINDLFEPQTSDFIVQTSTDITIDHRVNID